MSDYRVTLTILYHTIPYFSMVTIPHRKVGLEFMNVGLWRCQIKVVHCIYTALDLWIYT